MAYVREKNGFDLGEIDAPRDINLRGCVLSDVDIRQRHLRCFERQGYGISNQEEGCCVREAVARHRLGVIDLGGYLASLFDADNQLIA